MDHAKSLLRLTAIAGLTAGVVILSGAEDRGDTSTAGSIAVKPVQNCVAAVSGAGRGRFRGPAEMEATSNWRRDTAAAWGQNYANWNNAQGRDVTCGHDGKAIKTWTCTAYAVPCDPYAPPSPTPTGPAQPACYPEIAVEGARAVLQTGAQTNSIAAWRAQAASHGALYQDWNKAAGKDITCSHNGLGPVQRRWRCVAKGKPCK
jgi:hypothetical protein